MDKQQGPTVYHSKMLQKPERTFGPTQYIQYAMIKHNGKEYKKYIYKYYIYNMYIIDTTELLCCTAEINITL